MADTLIKLAGQAIMTLLKFVIVLIIPYPFTKKDQRENNIYRIFTISLF